MSRAQNPNSSSARRGLADGSASIRQRASNSLQLGIMPSYGRDRRNTGPRGVGAAQSSGKDKGKGKEKGRWEVGTKGWVKEGFRQFGAHCARNQIRTLLIDCLVMTNLFYPSLVVWYQKRVPVRPPTGDYQAGPSRIRLGLGRGPGPGHSHDIDDPLSVFSTPLLDSFFPDPPALLPRLSPSGWWHLDDRAPTDTDIHPTPATRWNASAVDNGDYLPGPIEDEEIRMVTIAWVDVESALAQQDDLEELHHDQARPTSRSENDLVGFMRNLVESWEADHPDSRERCVRSLSSTISSQGVVGADGPCYLISRGRIRHSFTTPISEIAHRPLSGSGDKDEFYHSVSALFRIPRSTAKQFSHRWLAAVRNMTGLSGGSIYSPPANKRDIPKEWRLSFSAEPKLSDSTTTEESSQKPENRYSKYFIFGYVAMFVILVFQVNFATRVHSKIGLAVTGIVQLCCSAIMSLSVLALIGWNGWGWSSLPSSVPAWVLPMVIVIVGVENMSTLTKAVFSVPFHYSVPERIGLGLSRSGLKILFTSLTNVLALAIIWFFVDVVPVREFCLFAITVNITDWFMLHTFYLTVLSIDAQRLELADVLASSGNQDPATQTVSIEEADDDTHILSWRGLLASRMLSSGTLILTLVCVGVIYYMTNGGSSSLSSPTSLYHQAKQTLSTLPRSYPFATTANDLAGLSKSEGLWRALNPAGWPFVRLVVPTASIIVLPTSGHSASPLDVLKLASPASRRLPRLKPFFYLFKVVVLPQALTAGSLWALLAYLLKDADLLDAQRDRGGRGEDKPNRSLAGRKGQSVEHYSTIISRLRVDMLPCGHASDIETIAASRKGGLAISVSIDDTISLWRFHNQPGTGTREILRASTPSSSITACAISPDESHVAVATANGSVQIWRLVEDAAAKALEPFSLSNLGVGVRVIGIQFTDESRDTPNDLFRPNSNDTAFKVSNTTKPPTVTVLCSDTSVYSVSHLIGERISHTPSQKESRLLVPSTLDASSPIVAIGPYEETLHQAADEWDPISLQSHRAPGDSATTISPIRHLAGHRDDQLLAIGRASGLVEIFDTTGTLIAAIGQTQDMAQIQQVDIACPASSRCTGCNVTCDEGFYVVSTSAEQKVFIDRIIPPHTLVCRCSVPRRSFEESARASVAMGSPSKSAESLVVPPSAARAKISPSTSPRRSPSLLPPTSNGEFPLSSHGTRKLSAYQSHDNLTATPTSAMNGSLGLSVNDTNGENGLVDGQPSQPDWSDMEVFPLGAISAPDGHWIVVDDTILGLRRSSPGIGHDQWQVWAVDLTAPYNGSTLNVETIPLIELEGRTRDALFAAIHATSDTEGYSSSAQRTERLLSLSGRATFPPIRGSLSVPTYPNLAYIEVGAIQPKGPDGFIAGFGNQIGVFTLEARGEVELDKSRYGLGAMMTPRSRLNSASAGAGGMDSKRPLGMMGLTPPPPRKVSEDRKGK